MPKLFTDDYKYSVLRCLNSLKVYQLSRFPHYVHTTRTLYLNENDESDDEDDEKGKVDTEDNLALIADLTTAYPKYFNFSTDINDLVNRQIAEKIVQQKNQYIYDILKLRTLFLNFDRSKRGQELREDGVYDSKLYNMIKMVHSDPDPYFYGPYNWYFTGGNLEIISVDDVDFIFHVTGPNMNIFNSSLLKHKKDDDDDLEIQRLDREMTINNSMIYEVIRSDCSSYIAARQKHDFSVFNLQNDSLKCDFRSDKVPFISGTFQCDNFLSIDVNRTIKRYNLARQQEMGAINLKEPSNTTNGWCQLKEYNSHLLFADHKNVEIYDNRLFGQRDLKCFQINFGNIIEQCEDITCIKTDANENNVYVATTHNLLVFDIRNGKKGNGQVSRYTHQLKTSPFDLDASGGGISGNTANERLIVTAGNSSEDIVMNQHFKLKHKEKLFVNNLPQKILTSGDSYNQSRRNGISIEIMDNLINPNDVNTGVRFLRKNSKLYLITQQSSGQLLYQQIQLKDKFSNNDERVNRNFHFNRELPQHKKRIYQATTVTNFSSLKRILGIKEPFDNDKLANEKLPVSKWKKSIDQLSEYKDLLSTDLLAIWNIDLMRRNEDKPKGTEIVDRWLKTNLDSIDMHDTQEELPYSGW